MSRHAPFALSFAGALVVMVACGSDDPEPRPLASPSISSLAEAVCDLSFRCCARGELNYYLGPFVGEDDCVDRLVQQARLNPAALVDLSQLASLSDTALFLPNLGALDEAAAELRVYVDQQAVQACLSYLSEQPCNEPEEEEVEYCDPLEPPPDDTPCDVEKMFIGLLGEGAECTSGAFSLECAPGLVCATGTGLGVKGRCVEPVPSGGACFTDAECAEDLYCSQLEGMCTEPASEGQVCIYADHQDPSPAPETLLVRCEEDLFCDPITDTCVARCQAGATCIADEQCDEEQELKCIAGRCGTPRSLGMPCSSTADCVEGLQCAQDPQNPAQTTCQERLAVGKVCAIHDECSSDFCDPLTGVCAAQAPAGSLCPSGLSQQCDMGTCVQESPLSICTSSADCPITGVCDPVTSECAHYCVELLPDGAQCVTNADCASGACAAGFCRTLPLANGVRCDIDEQCESEYCSLDDEPVCKELPLGIGERCGSSEDCDSGVCFATGPTEPPICTNGLDEGEACGQPGLEPCNPKELYCDTETPPFVCTVLKETGEDCESSLQCRGECLVRFGRPMCTAQAADDAAICDGSSEGPSL